MKGEILLSAVALNLLFAAEILAKEAKLETVDIVEQVRHDERDYGAKELVKGTTRLNLTARQTPQSVDVITEAKLKDMNIKDYQTLLANIPGVTLNRMDETIRPMSRGFFIDYYLIDSMPSLGGFGLEATDMSMIAYDRVEVVRGANGLLAGAGNPAASLNFIRKRADSKELIGSLGVQAGSYDKYGVYGDVQTPITADGDVRARLAFIKEKAGSYMDFHKRENLSIYGVVDSDIGDSSWLSLGASYQDLKRRGIRYGGMPAFYTDDSLVKFSRKRIFSQPWTKWDIKTLDLYADFRHYIGEDASVNLSYSYKKVKSDIKMLYYGGKVNPDMTGDSNDVLIWGSKNDSDIHNLDAYANLPYELFGLGHEFVLGAMYNDFNEGSYRLTNFDDYKQTPAGLAYLADMRVDFNNLHIDDVDMPYVDQKNPSKTKQRAVYFANKLSLSDELKFLVGTRVSYYKRNQTVGNVDQKFTHQITPYVGLTYDVGQNHTLYASYTSIFKPQDVKDINGKYLDPIEGKDYELGIKGEYFDGALQASFGVFKIIQDNVGKATGEQIGSTGEDAYKAVKGVTSKGFELDLNGRVTDNLTLSFGLAHFQAKDASGKKFNTNAARTSADLFAKYEFRDFRVGAGLGYKSKTYIYNADNDVTITQKPYALANLMFGYKIGKNFDIQLNIDNVFDKRYYEGIGSDEMIYGDARTFNLSFTYNF